jgi:AraC-like DNA-binding protein
MARWPRPQPRSRSAARVLLIATRQSGREIAAASGFDTLQHFSAGFARCFGRLPGTHRQGWPKGNPAPSRPGTPADFLSAPPQRAGAG